MTGLRRLQKISKMVMSKKDSGQHFECETVINHYGSTHAVVDTNNLLL